MESKGNSEIVVGTLGLRYGLLAKAEVYMRISHVYSSHPNIEGSDITGFSDHGLTDAWIGVNYKFKGDEDTPALINFAEVGLYEKHKVSLSYVRSILYKARLWRVVVS